ncbi:DExH-box ATP-dependent RNA helicase DExH14-like, partial [Prunus avium]|uniref:DExH-box ATP-dependent RNA helicase DExH14-like n=1 Tax=Prunus avium TaxID=42229 RepID=A0A6P5RIE5_PRUAV
MNEDNVEPTMLGSIASQYYFSYMTVSMFGSNLGSSDTSLEIVLHILSAASEYNVLPVRHNEWVDFKLNYLHASSANGHAGILLSYNSDFLVV